MIDEKTQGISPSAGPALPRDVRLTFCIPTYNRGNFVGETLSSILPQCNDQVEVVIVDGASSDNTPDVVRAWQVNYPNLIYYRNDTNRGVDRDMAYAVELARGEYCWLMSSDDLIRPGSVDRILAELDSNEDIYLCDITFCDRALVPMRDSTFLLSRRSTDRFDLSDRRELITYLNLAASNNALFCYMSSIIFKRSRWMDVGFNERFDRTGYSHVFTLLSFIKSGCRLKYLPTPLVLNRADNDSFSNMGLERRYLLDFNGYLQLADALFFHDAEIRQRFLRVTTREHPWYRLVKFRSAISSQIRWDEICAQLLTFGYSRSTLTICDFLGRNAYLVKLAVMLNRRLSRSAILKWLR